MDSSNIRAKWKEMCEVWPELSMDEQLRCWQEWFGKDPYRNKQPTWLKAVAKFIHSIKEIS